MGERKKLKRSRNSRTQIITIEKNNKNKAPETVKLDDEQVQKILSSLQNMIEDNSKRISESILDTVDSKDDFASKMIKWVLSGAFVAVGLVSIIGVIGGWSTFFSDFKTGFIGGIIILYAIFFIVAAIDIIREKNRQYIIALFSALISLAAFIVAYVALIN